jgi:hypothetical protein
MASSKLIKISLLLPLFAISGLDARAQGNPKPQPLVMDGADATPPNGANAAPQRGIKPESIRRIKAREIAAATADEASKWDDKQAAVRIISQTADLLWEEDSDRSRAWLTQAWMLTGKVAEEDHSNEVRRYRNNSPQARARAIVLVVAQKRDQRLADKLLDQLLEQKEQTSHHARQGIFDDRTARSEQLLNMALATVGSDPAMAATLGERSLVDGLSFQLQSLLLALRQRDEAAANRVFDAALNRLTTGFANPSEGQVLISYLFTPGRVFGAGEGSTTALAVGTGTPMLERTPAESDPRRARLFLKAMQGIMLSMPAPSTTANPARSAQEFVTLGMSLAQGFKTYAPDLWEPIEQRMTLAVPDLAPAMADHRLSPALRDKLSSSSSTVDEKELNRLYVDGLEEIAEKESDPIARKLAFFQAAMATLPEELERGRRLAGKIDEREMREQVISFLVYRAALSVLEKGQFDEAVKLANETQSVQRAVILITAAQRIAGEGTREKPEQILNRRLRVLSLLSEAEKVLERNAPSAAASRVHLGLVAALAPLDAPRALEVFKQAVATINALDSFDVADTSAPRMFELDASAQSSVPRVRVGYGLKDALTPLARADFESSVLLAGKLSAPAVRGACMLEIAQSVLSPNAK